MKPRKRAPHGASVGAETRTTTHDDGSFVRTALVVTAGGNGGSVDVVDPTGRRLAQINLFWQPVSDDGEERLMLDVIDVDRLFPKRRALVFSPTQRSYVDVPEGGNLVATDFRRPLPGDEP